jgi:hypothetical protein
VLSPSLRRSVWHNDVRLGAVGGNSRTAGDVLLTANLTLVAGCHHQPSNDPLASNSLATSAARLRVCESAIVSRLLFSRKIRGHRNFRLLQHYWH